MDSRDRPASEDRARDTRSRFDRFVESSQEKLNVMSEALVALLEDRH